MSKSLFHIFLFILAILNFACNREKVNLEGQWEVVRADIPKGNGDARKDSVSQLMPHLAVGNKLDFTAGELTVSRKAAGDSTYYGFATYIVANDGKTALVDAGAYKPLTFQLKNLADDQVELTYPRQHVSLRLKPYQAED